MASVSFRNIQKTYGGKVKVIHGISFDIADGEFVVLVGPSGCGKSTLLRMLAGLEEISDGQIMIDDKVVNDLESKDRDIAMVFQSYALYPHMTVYDNMAFGLENIRVPKAQIEAKVTAAATLHQPAPARADELGGEVDQEFIHQTGTDQRSVEFCAGLDVQLVDLARAQVAQHGCQIDLALGILGIWQVDHRGPKGLQGRFLGIVLHCGVDVYRG